MSIGEKINLKIGRVLIIIYFCFSTTLSGCVDNTTECFTDLILPNDKIISTQKHTELLSKNKDRIEYLNEDGTRTIYLYSSPILTDNGNEIDNSLIQTVENERAKQGFNYVTKENNIKTYFSDNPCEDGFLITDGNTEMQVYIENDNKLDQVQHVRDIRNIHNQSIDAVQYYFPSYQNITAYSSRFGLSIEIDINPDDYLNYIVDIKDCVAETNCPEYVIFRHKKSNTVAAIIYAPFARVESGIVLGKLEISELEEGSFLIISSMDTNTLGQLGNEQIHICQSFDLYTSKQPDSTVYKNIETTNSYLSQFMFTGAKSSKGQSQTYVRFEALENIDIKANDIISAKYYVHSLVGTTSKTALCAYPVVDNWCSFTTDWTIKARVDKSEEIKPRALSSNDYEFDITEMLKIWMENRSVEKAAYSVRNGMVLIDANSKSNEVLASNDNGFYGTVLVLKIK